MRYVGVLGRQRPDRLLAWIVSAICAAALLEPSLALGASDKVLAKVLAGEVVSVQGTAFVRADGHDSQKALKGARGGDPVYEGDVINTGSNGKVKVMMKDRTIVDIGASALFKIDSYKPNGGADREVKVNMLYGSVRASVSEKLKGRGKFLLRTPAAIMGVRGTEFVVKSEMPKDLKAVGQAIANPGKPVAGSAAGGQQPAIAKTQVTVVQGRVDVEQSKSGRNPASAQPVALTAGSQLTAKSDGAAPAQAVQVDAKQMAAITSSVKVQDNTFQKAIVVDNSGGSGSGAGDATKAVMANAVIVSAAPTMSISSLGFAGTFGIRDALGPPPGASSSSLRTIHVTVVGP